MFAPQRTNYETKILPAKVFGPYAHGAHGHLTITRHAKGALNAQINFTLTFTPLAGLPVVAHCHVTADNADNDVFFVGMGMRGAANPNMRRAGASSVGYADINIAQMGNRGIIYLVHHAMGQTAVDLGVSAFVVTTIVNNALNHVCQLCGMRFAHHPTGWQGNGTTVAQRSLAEANGRGWH